MVDSPLLASLERAVGPGPAARSRRRFPRLRALAVVLACAVGLAFSGARAAGLVVPADPLPEDPIEAVLLETTNRARSEMGLGTVAFDARLALAARHHAREMAQLGYLGHTSPTPQTATLQLRLGRSGAPHTSVAENLAVVLGEPEPGRAAVDGWLASPGHRRNLLDPRFDRVGFGVGRADDGSIYLVQVLADAPRDLLETRLDRVDVALYGLELDFELAPTVRVPVDLLLAVDASTGRLVRASERTVTLEATLLGEGATRVRIGLPDATGGYVLASALRVDPARGTVVPEPGANDGRIALVGVTITEPDAAARRLVFRYAPSERELALVVDGRHRPSANVGGGRLELVLAGGVDRDLFVGHVGDAGIEVFHAFRLRWLGDRPQLLAGRDER